MSRVRFALGVAPEESGRYDDAVDALIRENASNKNVCAIGSCGLSAAPSDCERIALTRQIRIANEFGLPLVVQGAPGVYAELASLIAETAPIEAGILLRGFHGTAEELEPWVEAGAFISFDVRIANDPDAFLPLVRMVPNDRLVVESGAESVCVDALVGFPARTDQVVFAAEAIIDICDAAHLSSNVATLFSF